MKYLSIFIRVALLALGQSLDCHCASEVSLMDMGKSVNVKPQQSTAKQKPCAYFLGYTVCFKISNEISCFSCVMCFVGLRRICFSLKHFIATFCTKEWWYNTSSWVIENAIWSFFINLLLITIAHSGLGQVKYILFVVVWVYIPWHLYSVANLKYAFKHWVLVCNVYLIPTNHGLYLLRAPVDYNYELHILQGPTPKSYNVSSKSSLPVCILVTDLGVNIHVAFMKPLQNHISVGL